MRKFVNYWVLQPALYLDFHWSPGQAIWEFFIMAACMFFTSFAVFIDGSDAFGAVATCGTLWYLRLIILSTLWRDSLRPKAAYDYYLARLLETDPVAAFISRACR